MPAMALVAIQNLERNSDEHVIAIEMRYSWSRTFNYNTCLLQGQAVAQLAKTVENVTVFGVCSKSKHEALKANNNNIDHLLERGSDYTSEVRK